MSNNKTTGQATARRVEGHQPNLFDPDDHGLDRPVPFVLTARARRLVAPHTVPLRLVEGRAGIDAGHLPARSGDTQVQRELSETNGARHARARALRRSGLDVGQVADQLDVATHTATVWLADDPVTGPDLPAATGSVPAGQARDERGLALLAAIGDVEPGGVVATTNRIAVAAELVDWLRRDHGAPASAIRVVLRVAEAATADLVARAWADRLGLTVDRVLTTSWRRAPTARAVQAVIRVSGREMSTTLTARLAAWPRD